MEEAQPPELWGGLECTVARLENRFRNQIVETGHHDRLADLDSVAALGLRTLRYPVLWETVAPEHPDESDWRWHDERLGRMRELGIRPIAGLVHHGSGPRYTHLLDPAFPDMLARHAERTAARYPWIELFTPVNEPLTTARFSGLYGHWYPHGRDYGTFLRALVNQCRAVTLAMRAIRRITPSARLVQTEDLGRTFSTPLLKYQAEHENERRWLGFDLLCGRVDRAHPWHPILVDHGIAERELAFFLEAGSAPDLLGINHYLTSDRFLDQRLKRYPDPFRGGNGRHRYADVEAVRMELAPGAIGPEARLREAWERYGLPVAVTEVHHGCTRDEQLRWLMEVWTAAAKLRREGADIRAVTVWSLFGTVDWNTLPLCDDGVYEPGAFDVRGSPPRPTALARAAESLAATGRYDHPVLRRPGWWRRDDRCYGQRPQGAARKPAPKRGIVIAGGSGRLGRAFARICAIRGLDCVPLARPEMDVAEPASVEAALARYAPWAVVNCAGSADAAEAEREPERCFRDNVLGAEILARACRRRGIAYLTFSSDLVFDGRLDRPCVESDPVAPATILGKAKAEAERRIAEIWPRALVTRTGPLFGPWDESNFAFRMLGEIAAGRPLATNGSLVSPSYVPDLVHNALDLLIDDERGVWHLVNGGAMSWHELAMRLARDAGFDGTGIEREGAGANAVLGSERGMLMPPLESALDRFPHDHAIDWNARVSAAAIAAE